MRDEARFQARYSASPAGLASLSRPGDPDQVEFIRPGAVLGEIVIRSRVGKESWREASTSRSADVAKTDVAKTEPGRGPGSYRIRHEGPSANPGGLPALRIEQQFEAVQDALQWSIEIRNLGGETLEIGDLELPLPLRTDYEWDPEETFRRRLIRHAFVAGSASFLYWLPVKGTGPHLVLMPEEGTALEYFTVTGTDYAHGRGRYAVHIHSAASADLDGRGTWRLRQTSLSLEPGRFVRYGFTFRWADSLEGVRDLLYRHGGIDVRVAPGMVVPRDLPVSLALRTRRAIEALEAEHRGSTRIEVLEGRSPDAVFRRIRFDRLGENRLLVRFRGGGEVPLEFFVTEPLETLIKKRAAFLAARQQHRDPTKWYDGLFSLWDRRVPGGALLGPDRTGGLHPYTVSGSDDPSNGKCLYLSEKNVVYPEAREVEALEYFVERFVWGKHQRTDREQPHPWAIYGCDSWKACRESPVGLLSGGHGQERMWRTFDYTTYFALYFNLYRIARARPDLVRYLDARGYLERAYGTARAYFEVPISIEMKGWSFQGFCDWAYKVGNFHEKYLLPLIDALEREGEGGKASWLRAEWEKKVKYMIYDKPWPFASEMPVDSTAYETTHAVARYALTRALAPDTDLWLDRNTGKSYSHPVIDPARHRDFLARQCAANLACRGALEPSWFQLGSDLRGCGGSTYLLSYMSQMGGWALLDQALRFDGEPAENLRLGYASLLSSWALVNAGDSASGYGWWSPGPEHDGAASWGFEPKRFGPVWATGLGLGELPRGAWPVDGEIDHGLTAGVEAACTVLFDDPLFGLTAYGGVLVEAPAGEVRTIPRDGVRRRFHALIGNRRLHFALEGDGFAAERPIAVSVALDRIAFTLEHRSPGQHAIEASIEGLPPGPVSVSVGASLRTLEAELGRPLCVRVEVGPGNETPVEIRSSGGTREEKGREGGTREGSQ